MKKARVRRSDKKARKAALQLERRVQAKEKRILGVIRSGGMRHRPTRHEQMLFDALCELRFSFKFQPYFYDHEHLYIPDFHLYLPEGRLIVEVDGPSHLQQVAYDAARTEWLRRNRNCQVIRFTNEEVEYEIEKVLLRIMAYGALKVDDDRKKAVDNGTPKVSERNGALNPATYKFLDDVIQDMKNDGCVKQKKRR